MPAIITVKLISLYIFENKLYNLYNNQLPQKLGIFMVLAAFSNFLEQHQLKKLNFFRWKNLNYSFIQGPS